jgi:hypothetical protein
MNYLVTHYTKTSDGQDYDCNEYAFHTIGEAITHLMGRATKDKMILRNRNSGKIIYVKDYS